MKLLLIEKHCTTSLFENLRNNKPEHSASFSLVIHNYNLRKSKGNFPFSFLLPLPFIHSLIKTEMFKTNIPRAEYPPFFNHRRQLSANKNRCYERQEKAGLGFG